MNELVTFRTVGEELVLTTGRWLLERQHDLKKIKTTKDTGDLVTKGDDEASDRLINVLRGRFPGIPIICEETCESAIDIPESWALVVDPVDGSSNFSRGSNHWAVSIGLVKDGISQAGCCWTPGQDGKGELFFADVAGARLNGKLISPSTIDSLKQAVVLTDWPWDLERRPFTVQFMEKMYPLVRQIKIMGSAVADICDVACGRVDMYFHPGLKPWDIAAAGRIAERAGCIVYSGEHKIEGWSPWQQSFFVCTHALTADPLGLLYRIFVEN